jgi:hypothetical protein
MQEGDMVKNEFFCGEGLFKIVYHGWDKKMHVLQFALPDWWITD